MIFHDKRKDISFSLLYFIKIIIIPLLGIVILTSTYMMSQYIAPSYEWILILPTISVIIINILFFVLYDQLTETMKISMENSLLSKQILHYNRQYKKMELHFQEISNTRHDLKHILLSIQSKLDKDDYGVIEATKEITKVIGKLNIKLDNVLSGVPIIDAIINYHIEVAQIDHIKIEAKFSLQRMPKIDDMSLAIILGNALDNAVHACKETQTVTKTIFLVIQETQDNLYILISNPYSGERIFKDGLPITTKQNSLRHGIGLRSIARIVNENHGIMKIYCENHIFNLEIIFFDIF